VREQKKQLEQAKDAGAEQAALGKSGTSAFKDPTDNERKAGQLVEPPKKQEYPIGFVES